MIRVCTREFLPEARAWRIPVRFGLLPSADRGLLPEERLGLDCPTRHHRGGSIRALANQKALQRHAFLASFSANGGFARETA